MQSEEQVQEQTPPISNTAIPSISTKPKVSKRKVVSEKVQVDSVCVRFGVRVATFKITNGSSVSYSIEEVD